MAGPGREAAATQAELTVASRAFLHAARTEGGEADSDQVFVECLGELVSFLNCRLWPQFEAEQTREAWVAVARRLCSEPRTMVSFLNRKAIRAPRRCHTG